jgi:hypothetical protein
MMHDLRSAIDDAFQNLDLLTEVLVLLELARECSESDPAKLKRKIEVLLKQAEGSLSLIADDLPYRLRVISESLRPGERPEAGTQGENDT